MSRMWQSACFRIVALTMLLSIAQAGIASTGADDEKQAVFSSSAARVLPGAIEDGKTRRLPLPEEFATNHAENAVLDLEPFPLPSSGSFKPGRLIKLEASYDESITLRHALIETLRHNLPIRISKESWNYQKYQLFANLASFLPSFNLGYNLTGSKISPGSISAGAEVFSTQVTYPVFEGGSVMYSAIAQAYRNAGWRHAYESTINDSLLNVYNRYVELVLQDAILRIRAHALSLSKLLVDVNTHMYEAGTATQFDIMQSRTQYSLDSDAFIQQQMTSRQAALELAYAINLPISVNLIPKQSALSEVDLFPHFGEKPINFYVSEAIVNRPELRQYEMFRLAAARTVQTAAAPLYPNVSFFTAYADTKVSSNANSDASDSTLENAGVFTGDTKNFQLGFNLTWTLSNMGALNAANIVSARALSRQAMVQANQELLTVMQQVRTNFDQSTIARNRIDAAAGAAASGKEALRLAHLRLNSGLGTNLELIEAQKSYINALITQAQAITASNKAQAGLLHATGLISIDGLVDGYAGDKKAPRKNRPFFKFW